MEAAKVANTIDSDEMVHNEVPHLDLERLLTGLGSLSMM